MTTELIQHMNPMQRAVLDTQMRNLADLFLQYTLINKAGNDQARYEASLVRLQLAIRDQTKRIERVCTQQVTLWEQRQ